MLGPHQLKQITPRTPRHLRYQENMSAVFRAMSAYFSRDNVALPGVALFFKVYSQIEINDIWFFVEFLTKRGQHPQIGAHAAPPKDFHRTDCSDVLYCFEKALALVKCQYTKCGMLYKTAADKGDALAVGFSTYLIDAVSIKLKQLAHYVAHLKVVENDKHAIKEFDRRLPYEIEDLAKSTGAEAVIPSRLMIDCVKRSVKTETALMNPECFDDIKSRRVFNRVI
ncbi:hypothetical protein WJX72_002955 [[Myrmecia] bisecta]|uniref:Ferritin/DPS domain-containing protein n=1 Tax=[Myrmecia] bisecta TaxID=41462 RepID=A0AAW1Q4E2_9CHLO